jgi:signal transduction histidine kinase
MADTTLLRLVFVNLLSNALKFSRSRNPAVIRVSSRIDPDSERWIFEFQDNGVGFQQKKADKLFGVFQRLHPDFEGTGIGLAQVRRIVHRHGGRTWAEGNPDQGATFFFTLPKSAQSADIK